MRPCVLTGALGIFAYFVQATQRITSLVKKISIKKSQKISPANDWHLQKILTGKIVK